MNILKDVESILPGLKHMKHEIPDDAVCDSGGYINDLFYKEWGKEMRKNNPMFDKQIVEKMRQTKLRKFASGELVPRKLSDEEKKNLSERMKRNNPLKNNPSLAGKPVDVYYEDGTIKSFDYAKQIPIPYATVKIIIRQNRGSKKHKILKIVQR